MPFDDCVTIFPSLIYVSRDKSRTPKRIFEHFYACRAKKITNSNMDDDNHWISLWISIFLNVILLIRQFNIKDMNSNRYDSKHMNIS